ncbi:MAG: hypothetical protein FJ109_05265 [Deltaproteobacteria bacterium]|nr:hypothetical protein [Deltaproteobacteria bacterium]
MTKALCIVPLLLLAAPAAQAADIYINGQLVRGVTNVRFENVAVEFTAKGELHITAPDFKVHPAAAQGEQAAAPTGEVALLKNRYFLFTQTASPGKIPYNFEVLVNDKPVKQFGSELDQLTVELTLYLKPGKNTITIRSSYQARGGGTAADQFQVLVGRGTPNGAALEINKLLVNHSRKGSDTGDAGNSFDVDIE